MHTGRADKDDEIDISFGQGRRQIDLAGVGGTVPVGGDSADAGTAALQFGGQESASYGGAGHEDVASFNLDGGESFDQAILGVPGGDEVGLDALIAEVGGCGQPHGGHRGGA